MGPVADQIGAQFVLCLALELPHALAAQVEPLSDLLQGLLPASEETEAIADDVALAIVQADQRLADQVIDLLLVDLVFLVLCLGIGEEYPEATFLVGVHEVVDRELFLQHRNDHRVLSRSPRRSETASPVPDLPP